MLIYPDDRVLVVIMNNHKDWQRVQEEQWYRIPTKQAPAGTPNFDWIAFYFSKVFKENKWAIHFYAPVLGHELLTRRDLIPVEPNHPNADKWYYRLALGSLHHNLPPIVSDTWRRVTFIVTTGDRFEAAEEIKDLLNDYSPTGHPFVRLREQQEKFEGDES